MRILYIGHWSALTGYGRACRDYIAALHRTGAADVGVLDWRTFPGAQELAAPPRSPEARFADLDPLVSAEWPSTNTLGMFKDGSDAVICHAQPLLLAQMVDRLRPGTNAIAMTTWETDRIGDELAVPLSQYRALIVPSHFSAQAFRRAGLATYVVPHAFDPAVWRRASSLRQCGGERWVTNFYAMGAFSERKNHQAIIRAYIHAFDADDPVSLTIHALNAQEHHQAIRSLLARSGIAMSQLPEMHIRHEPMGDQELLAFHQAGHVFVTAARSEGWGLPLFEAVTLGKPVITCLHGGQIDYLVPPEPSSFAGTARGAPYSALRAVTHQLTPCFAGAGALAIADGQLQERASAVPGMTAKAAWAEPSICDLAARMQGMHAQISRGNAMVGTPAEHDELVQRFGYDAVARDLVTTLQEIVR